MEIIAHIRTDFPSKFGIPRQAGLIDELEGRVVFTPRYRTMDAVRGITGFSHLWLLWAFSEAVRPRFSATVRPPRLGGNVHLGVFATRSPFRPNPIGLSCVRLTRLEEEPALGPVLFVRGADLMDGTPLYDIKPYLPFADCHPEATGGFAAPLAQKALRVDFPEPLLCLLPEGKRAAACAVLAQDPRPAYQDDPTRVYGLPFAGVDLRFTVSGDTLTVVSVSFDPPPEPKRVR